jgi:transcriptional regulator with XRE-family HTH domain
VLTGSPIIRARAEVPPNRSMMSAAVIDTGYNENRELCKGSFANSVIYPNGFPAQPNIVFTTGELLARLDERGVKNAAIARALNVSPSRVTEIKKGERRLQLDEAAKLVVAFELESPPSPARVVPLSGRVTRLLVEYVALELGCDPVLNQARIDELTKDVRAFAAHVADPKARDSEELAETFFQALRLRRLASEEEVPEGSDPLPIR